MELGKFTPAKYATFGALASALEGHAIAAGFKKISFYAVPGGFAMLVQPETIGTDLRPLEPRFAIGANDTKDKPFFVRMIEYIGRVYGSSDLTRQIVFVFSTTQIAPNSALTPAEADTVSDLFPPGAFALPLSLSPKAVPSNCKATVLIYAFDTDSAGTVQQRFYSANQQQSYARRHLDGAGLTAMA